MELEPQSLHFNVHGDIGWRDARRGTRADRGAPVAGRRRPADPRGQLAGRSPGRARPGRRDCPGPARLRLLCGPAARFHRRAPGHHRVERAVGRVRGQRERRSAGAARAGRAGSGAVGSGVLVGPGRGDRRHRGRAAVRPVGRGGPGSGVPGDGVGPAGRRRRGARHLQRLSRPGAHLRRGRGRAVDPAGQPRRDRVEHRPAGRPAAGPGRPAGPIRTHPPAAARRRPRRRRARGHRGLAGRAHRAAGADRGLRRPGHRAQRVGGRAAGSPGARLGPRRRRDGADGRRAGPEWSGRRGRAGRRRGRQRWGGSGR